MTSKQSIILSRRKLLTFVGVSGIVAGTAPTKWSKPVISSVLLPAHAQTSCTTDAVVGGPLLGHSSGAANCQLACEAEAADLNAQLCSVEETIDMAGATQCSCSVDLP